jgi:hypothetical protein
VSIDTAAAIKPAKNNYIDPKGYWISPDRTVRRMGDNDGKQVAIIRATPDCSDAEWERMYEAIVACINVMKT